MAASAASASSGTKTAAFKAAWIYVGPHNDGGWSQAHDAGRLYVQKMLGSKVQTTFKENVPEGPQVTQVIEQLVRDGNKIIFATSFGYQDAMAAEAKKHPDVLFEQATGTTQSKNLAEYYGAGEDGIYLSGIAAGAASKKGDVGYVVPFAIPEVIRHANAFTLGVQTAHPGAKVRLVWTNSWFDPKKEKQAAESLISAGCRRRRPERRQPRDRTGRTGRERPVGRVRLRRDEVRAEVVADRRRLRLGPVLPEPGQGGDGGHLEDGLLLRQPEGRLRQARAVRQERRRRRRRP